jgi:hypothetical protein
LIFKNEANILAKLLDQLYTEGPVEPGMEGFRKERGRVTAETVPIGGASHHREEEEY